MRSILPLLLLALLSLTACEPKAERPRLLVMTDIGVDPDDIQSMIRLMLYTNEFEIEGLIATSSGLPGELEVGVVRPDIIKKIIRAYGEVRPNLMQHADGWPETQALLDLVKVGKVERGLDFIGEGQDTEGSQWLIERVDAGKPSRPLNITIWGGQTELAQALWRVRKERGEAGLADFVRRFRVYDISDQDEIADWMGREFPGMYYILSQPPAGKDRRLATFRGMYLGGDMSTTSKEWIAEHVHSTGPLGALYPEATWTAPNPHKMMKEGDTPAWFFFLPMGGNDPEDPSQPGWGGQFKKGPDGWYHDLPLEVMDPRDTVNQWRPVFQEDFAKRMSWCLPAR